MKIILTGGSGRFGKIFQTKTNLKNVIYPSKKQLNILNIRSIQKYFKKNNIATLKKIKNDLQIENIEILSFALNDIVNDKTIFRNGENRLGYLIYKSL